MRSSLGHPLRVLVPVSGAEEDVLAASCVKARIETISGEFIATPRVDVITPTSTNSATYLSLNTRQLMQEPALKLTIAMTCGTAIERSYALLLDFSAPEPEIAPAPASVSAPVTPLPADVLQVLERPVKRSRPAPVTLKAEDIRQVLQQSSERQSKYPAKPVSTGNVSKDRLKISNLDAISEFDLKMSQVLTEQSSSVADAQRNQENRQAQARFAALLRGEDPLLDSQSKQKTDQQKIKQLETEVEQLKQQSKLKAAQEQNTSPYLIGLILLAFGLFAGLSGMIWLVMRRRAEAPPEAWWDPLAEQKKNVVDMVDMLQTSAEQGELDPVTKIDLQAGGTNNEKKFPDTDIDFPNPSLDPSPRHKRMGLPSLEDSNSSTFNFMANRGHSIQIEEISDITQEAEFWMSVNDPHRAIEILEPQSHDENPTMPVTWLYLLDLYRMVGDEEKYRELRRRFKRKFNASIPEFDEDISQASLRHLEDFEHLLTKCIAFWKTDEILPYLESLLVDDREGERMGFDLPVYRDILFLISICNEIERTKKLLETLEMAPPITEMSTIRLPVVDIIPEPEPEQGEYPNSLNFDLLDFKTDKKA